jgi:predicted Rossmann fold nucleotide-binding protein DprA/Smf involved in DNA uptake
MENAKVVDKAIDKNNDKAWIKKSKYYSIPLSDPLTPQRMAGYLRSDKSASLRFISNAIRVPIKDIVDNLRLAKQLGLVECTAEGWRALRQ